MSIFGSIVEKIVHAAESAVGASAAPSQANASPTSPEPTAASGPAPGGATTPEATPIAPSPGATSGATPLAAIDVGAVLSKKAADAGGDLHWKTSIVDLLKLLDLDSSLAARKQLADELDVHAGEPGSAEENEALHRAVVEKLAENGGTLPASMTA